MYKIFEIKLSDPRFPSLLRQIPDAPKQIFAAGNLDLLNNQPCLAVVGTRKCSAYGLSITEKFSKEAAESGIVIISGLARGIDAAAHKAALKAKGKTIAVLGSGINPSAIYPPEHKYLAREIVESGGLILSEYPPEAPGLKFHFPARNRIIAGLTQAILVTEAPEKSGALITAYLALDYNREVLAIPGNINSPNSAGPNNLLQQGAKIIISPQEILDLYGINKSAAGQKELSLSAEEQKIYGALSAGRPLTLSELIEETNLETKLISQSLTTLELSELIIVNSDGRYAAI